MNHSDSFQSIFKDVKHSLALTHTHSLTLYGQNSRETQKDPKIALEKENFER